MTEKLWLQNKREQIIWNAEPTQQLFFFVRFLLFFPFVRNTVSNPHQNVCIFYFSSPIFTADTLSWKLKRNIGKHIETENPYYFIIFVAYETKTTSLCPTMATNIELDQKSGTKRQRTRKISIFSFSFFVFPSRKSICLGNKKKKTNPLKASDEW